MKSMMMFRQRGFTLIELMTVVIIVGILAAIALPSYQRYVIKNAESDARARMGQIQVELERWRTSALSYRGFFPSKTSPSGGVTYEYDFDNRVIYVPSGSNQSNFQYQIELLDGAGARSLSDPAALGRTWVMRATPNSNNSIIKNAHVYVQQSTGLRCSANPSNAGKLKLTMTECKDAGLEVW